MTHPPRRSLGCPAKIRKEKAKYRESKGRELDLKNAWWTPPLSPRQAWHLEKTQIQETLGKEALVSLSDHDNIEAGVNLLVMEETRSCPVSIEWTVPFRRTFFHLGIHNLPPDMAVQMARVMNEFTAVPDECEIAPILEWLGAAPETLIILNHPMWDESHIGEAAHVECLGEFLTSYSKLVHALELNGLRPWSENLRATHVAKRHGLVVVSGGDRHGREPNACINLTNAKSFPEFVAEIRGGAGSDVLFLSQYREPLKMRIVENIIDILDDDPNHAMGWNHWTDRVFYRNELGAVRSLNDLWGDKLPRIVHRFALGDEVR